MYVYTDQTSADSIYQEKTTPAHLYAGENDFSAILEEMLNGAVPFNTRQIYPTIWKADIDMLNQMQNGQQPTQPNNPWMKGFNNSQW